MPDDVLHLIQQDPRRPSPEAERPMTFYGFRPWNICVACESPIGADDVEVECDLSAGGSIRLHRKCYEIWSTEWPSCEVTR